MLHDRLTRQAAERPDAVAVVMRTARLTYGELEAQSNRLAWRLRRAGVTAGDRVAILMPKSPLAVAAILAALKAGAIYVPLDPASPPARLARMIRVCAPRCLLLSAATAGTAAALASGGDLAGAALGWLDERPAPPALPPLAFMLSDAAAEPPTPPPYEAPADDAAYILFTSGSTGIPKGVVVTHASVACFVDWAVDYFGLGPADRISAHAPLHFDLSVFDLFGGLGAGAEIHLVPAEVNVVPTALAALIEAARLTQWFSVPSVLTQLAAFDLVHRDRFAALRRVLWCGEVLPTPVLRHWMTRLPDVSFTNLYGPTEATIASTYFTVVRCPAEDTAPTPIGRPCPGEDVLVLDEALAAVPPSVVGDLHISGAGLSPGYWRDPDKTRAAFVDVRVKGGAARRMYRTGDRGWRGEDGLLYFAGRTDAQVKSRGHRIELGEIEAALHTVPVIREGAVVAVDRGGFEGIALCCAFVPGASGVAPAAVREAIGRLLPRYMVPSEWRVMDALPRNANGKIDRGRLRELFDGRVLAAA